MADIGTDHGRLPLYLIEQNIVPFAVASDRIKTPIAALKRQVCALGWEDKISVRLGDGLTVVAPEEIQTIVISGMGGMTMIEILDQCPQTVQKSSCLILQPQRSILEVRRWLVSHHWRICREDLVLEDGRYYEILCAEPGEMVLTEREINFGPILLQEKPDLFGGYLVTHKDDAYRLLDRLKREPCPTSLAEEKIKQVEALIREIDEVMVCL